MIELFLQDLIKNQENFDNNNSYDAINEEDEDDKSNNYIEIITTIILFFSSCYAAYLSWNINKKSKIRLSRTITAFIFGILYNIYYYFNNYKNTNI